MKRLLALILACAAMPSQAGQQCVWPFRAGLRDVGGDMRAMLEPQLGSRCGGQHQFGVTFQLEPGAPPSHVKVDAPTCRAAEKLVSRWIRAQPVDAFMPYQEPQDVAFKVRIAFNRT